MSEQKMKLLAALQNLRPGSLATQAEVDEFANIFTEFVKEQGENMDRINSHMDQIDDNMEDIYRDDIVKMSGLMFIEHKGLNEEFEDYLTAQVAEVTREGLIQ